MRFVMAVRSRQLKHHVEETVALWPDAIPLLPDIALVGYSDFGGCKAERTGPWWQCGSEPDASQAMQATLLLPAISADATDRVAVRSGETAPMVFTYRR